VHTTHFIFRSLILPLSFTFRLVDEISHDQKHTIKPIIFQMLCNGNQSMTSVKKDLASILTKFEVSKSQLSSSDRRLMRQHFLDLAQQCQKLENFEQVVLLAKTLADHAYKLPERE
jgi:hypothetical protein